MLENLLIVIVIIIAFIFGYFLISRLFDLFFKKRMLNDKYSKNEKKQTRSNANTSENSDGKHNLNTQSIDILILIGIIGKHIDFNSNIKRTLIEDFFKKQMKLDSFGYFDAIKIIENAKNSESNFHFYANRVYQNNHNKNYLSSIISLFLNLSLIDGKLDKYEDELLNKISDIFDLQDNAYFQYKKKREKNDNSYKDFKSDNDTDKYYAKILGLKGKMNKSEIKKIYRELVLKYHPDRVQHLGNEFQKLAERKFKEINEAYLYFKNKRNL